jgi:hypothetical protein
MFDLILGFFGGLFNPIFASSREAFERETDYNIEYLSGERWFQVYISNDKYNSLNVENKKVRRIIGLINIKKMSRSNYHKKTTKKIENIIQKQASKK